MEINDQEIQKIRALIDKNRKFLIIPHRSPDGDTIGAALAMFQLLSNMGKSVKISCYDEAPEEFNFMPNIRELKKGEPEFNFDAYFILDAGATHLTGFNESHPELFDKSLEVVNIDHHKSNDFYGKYNIVDSSAASTTMVLYEMFKKLNFEIDRYMATCLLTGIYTDTGSFMHSNTTAEVMHVAGRLLAKGANLRTISKEIFNTTKISTMRLWGRVLKNIQKTPEGITMSIVKQKDFDDTCADYSEMTGVVDYINSVPDSEYSVILTEKEGKVKGSLRTLDEDVDVAKIASQFGGGGHTKAAGFTISGHLQKEVRWKVVEG